MKEERKKALAGALYYRLLQSSDLLVNEWNVMEQQVI